MFSYLDFTFARVPSAKLRLPSGIGHKVMSMRSDSSYGF
jgi:hypothetical protein